MDVELELVESKSLTGDPSQAGIFTADGRDRADEGDTMAGSRPASPARARPSPSTRALRHPGRHRFYSLCPGSEHLENPEWDWRLALLSFEVRAACTPSRSTSRSVDEYPEFVNLGFNDEFT